MEFEQSKKQRGKIRIYMALPRTLVADLDSIADWEGEATRAAVIRQALSHYVEKHDRQKKIETGGETQ